MMNAEPLPKCASCALLRTEVKQLQRMIVNLLAEYDHAVHGAEPMEFTLEEATLYFKRYLEFDPQ